MIKKITLSYFLLGCLLQAAPGFAQGSTCDEAIAAVEGINDIPNTLSYSTWSTFTMPDLPDQKLIISPSINVYYYVYYNNCSSLYYAGSGSSEKAFVNIPTGSHVFIEWYNNGEDFKFTLTTTTASAGETCNLAVLAMEGENSVPQGTLQNYWLTTTSPGEDRKLRLTFTHAAQVIIHTGSCDALFYRGNGYEMIETIIPQETEVYIQWVIYDFSGFKFDLQFVDPEPGDLCQMSIQIEKDTPNMISETKTNPQWHLLTTPEPIAGQKLVISSDTDVFYEVYTGSCDSYDYIGYGFGNGWVTEFPPVSEFFIVWYPAAYDLKPINWSASFQGYGTGDVCELAIPVSIGANNLFAQNGSAMWTTVTMPEGNSTTLAINLPSGFVCDAYAGTCDNLTYKGWVYTNGQIDGVQPGETLFLIIYAYTYQGNFDLEITPVNDCSSAETAERGVNYTPVPPHWFKFTTSATGDVTISSLGQTLSDTYLRVYNSCNGSLLGQNDDAKGTLQSFLVLQNIPSGTELLIQWDDTYDNEAFNWTIQDAQSIAMAELEDKTYGDPFINLSASSSSGLAVSFAVQNGPATIDGNKLTITAAGEVTIIASQSGNAEYTSASIQRSFTVAKATLHVTADDKEITFGQAIPVLTLSYEGFVNNEDAGVLDTPPLISTTAVAGSNAGTYDITLSGGSDNNYQFELTNAHLTIAKASQQISFTPPGNKSLGDPPFSLNQSASSGLTVSVNIVEGPAVLSGNQVTLIDGQSGLLVIELTQSGNSNFLAAPTVTINVLVLDPAKAFQEIQFDPITPKTYGGSLILGAQASSGLPVTYTVTGGPGQLNANTLFFTGAGNISVKATQIGNNNFNAAVPIVQIITVTKAFLTVKANNEFTPFGVIPEFTATYTGFVNGDNVFDLDQVPGYSLSATTASPPGSYVVTPTGGGDNNYNYVYVDGYLTIYKAPQTILFDPLPERSLVAAPFHLSARATSQLPVSYQSSNPAVATIVDDEVIVHGLGSTIIKATQTGNGNYVAAEPVEQTLLIKNDQALTFGSLPSKQFGDAPFQISAVVSSGLTATFTSSNDGVATISGNIVTITGAGTTVITALQPGTSNYLAASPIEQLLFVSPGTHEINFDEIPDVTIGAEPITLAATASSGLTPTFITQSQNIVLSGNSVEIVQPGLATIIARQDGNANYLEAPPVQQTFCINPERPSITIEDIETEAPKLVSDAPFGNQWYRNGEPINGEKASILSLETGGVYTVIVSIGGCSSEASIEQPIIITGVEVSNPQVAIYPVPAKDVLTIDATKLNGNEQIEIVVVNLLGAPVIKTNGERITTLSIADLTPGVYEVQIKTRHDYATGRIVKK